MLRAGTHFEGRTTGRFSKDESRDTRLADQAVTVGRQVLRFAPPILSGHGLDARDQVVLGAMTLAELHKKLGDSVTLDNGYRRQRLVIVGTATMPSMTTSGLGMGTGALVSTSDFPTSQAVVESMLTMHEHAGGAR